MPTTEKKKASRYSLVTALGALASTLVPVYPRASFNLHVRLDDKGEAEISHGMNLACHVAVATPIATEGLDVAPWVEVAYNTGPTIRLRGTPLLWVHLHGHGHLMMAGEPTKPKPSFDPLPTGPSAANPHVEALYRLVSEVGTIKASIADLLTKVNALIAKYPL